MATLHYEERRGQLLHYFDRTAVDAWARLTSTAPLGRIRATVRAGRDRMRSTLLGYLPENLQGRTLLDAGCGTGALSTQAAARGGRVTAVDLSPTLVVLARQRLPSCLGTGRIEFRVGDMFDPALGRFDHVVAMDSLIYYSLDDVVRILAGYSSRTARSIVFTFAPKTKLLTSMWAVGRLFPRGDRAPTIEPLSERRLRHRIAQEPALAGWCVGRSERISCGFYISQAMELVRQ